MEKFIEIKKKVIEPNGLYSEDGKSVFIRVEEIVTIGEVIYSNKTLTKITLTNGESLFTEIEIFDIIGLL